MAVPLRGIGGDEMGPKGGFIVRKHTYTLATYSAAGTYVPHVNDVVSPGTGANDAVVLTPDNTVKFIGRVVAVQVADLTVDVQWFDVYAFVKLAGDDMSQFTLGNSAIKDGNTTVVNNFDGLATTGNLVIISKSGTSGAGFVVAAVVMA